MGIWDVNQMLNDMPASLFQEWTEYAEIEPFGEKRADVRTAMALSALINSMGAKPPTKPADFIHDFSKTKEELDEEAMKNVAKQVEINAMNMRRKAKKNHAA